jgi:hypothetical protein
VYTAKEEASSPTVSIESIMLSCVIDAKEGRHVATANIPGAFMQADMDEVPAVERGARVRSLRHHRERETGPVRAVDKSAVRHSQRGVAFLEEADLPAERVGVRDERL